MNNSDMLRAITERQAEESFTDDYKKPENLEARKRRGLGIAISIFCRWNGLMIMEIFEAALEDANFHTEAAQVSEMIKREEAR